jgi:predicted ATPase
MIFLKNILLIENKKFPNAYPFNIPAFSGNNLEIEFKSNINFLLGENGSGKTTLLEAIAKLCGFNLAGGSKNHNFTDKNSQARLASMLKLSWSKKVAHGFFMRAENFYNFASYMDELAEDDPRSLLPYGNKSLHRQSHGEAFLSLFKNKFKQGIYLLDEPESALSPQRQLAFLSILH